MRGLSDENGSWKITWIRRRSFRIARASSVTRLMPSNSTVPAVGSMRRRIMRPVVDLPQPDSPTRPSVSPGMTSNETPSTARTAPAGFAEQSLLDREMLRESANGQERRRRVAALAAVTRPPSARASRARRAGSSARWQRDTCAAADLIQRRMLRGAALPRVRAAVVKAAALRPLRRRRHGAGNRREPLALLPDLRHRVEQAFRVRVVRAREQVADRRFLDDLAAVHHDDARRRLRDDAQVVRDEQNRRAELLLQVAQQLENLRLDGDVERGRRLVGDDERRIHDRAPSR